MRGWCAASRWRNEAVRRHAIRLRIGIARTSASNSRCRAQRCKDDSLLSAWAEATGGGSGLLTSVTAARGKLGEVPSTPGDRLTRGHRMNDQPTTVITTATGRHQGRSVRADRRGRTAKWLLLLIVLAAMAGAAGYWYLTKDQATTDDAYTDGNAVTIAPQVAGEVVARDVTDNQRVKAGQVLIEIDPRPYQAARDQAAASLQVAAGAACRGAGQPGDRAGHLAGQAGQRPGAARRGAGDAVQGAGGRAPATRPAEAGDHAAGHRQRRSPRCATPMRAVAEAQANVRGADIVAQSIAQAEAQVHQLEAQVALAQAQLDQAELNLAWTKVRAPQDGWVTKRNVDKGNYVQVGQSVMALVTPDVWVTANFKEDQLDRMRPGQRVDIGVDAFPGLQLVGHVDSVQLGSGSRFSAFPAENATGNFVKIVQRVPVKIVIDSGLDPAHPLPLGISVDPVVRLK